MRRVAALALVLAGVLLACGEPAVDVELPDRAAGAHVADLAGILDAEALEVRLAELEARGLDVVALTYETDQANCGEAFRAGLAFATAWDADVAVVAVARPGDFLAEGDGRERCLGLRPVDDFAVRRGTRERIAEQLVPPLAAGNRWDEAFAVAADVLEADVLDAGATEAGGTEAGATEAGGARAGATEGGG